MGNKDELEVKFYLSRRSDMEARILAVGAEPGDQRVYEINLRLDTPYLDLQHEGKLLRLRLDKRARLTYKGEGRISAGTRLRRELEVTVSDFYTTQSIFEALGFEVTLMYEKYRTTYHLGELEIVIDEMPYGDFLEIEGPDGDSICQAAAQLGLDWEARSLDSYTLIFEHARAQLGLPFRDLSFENFKGLQLSPADLGVLVADAQ